MNKILKIIIYALFSAATLFAGIPKIILADGPVNMLSAFNYSPVAMQLLGVVWVLTAICVWFESLRSYAALAATHILAGFVATHIATATPLNLSMIAYALLPLLVLWADNFFLRISPGAVEGAKHLGKDIAEEQ